MFLLLDGARAHGVAGAVDRGAAAGGRVGVSNVTLLVFLHLHHHRGDQVHLDARASQRLLAGAPGQSSLVLPHAARTAGQALPRPPPASRPGLNPSPAAFAALDPDHVAVAAGSWRLQKGNRLDTRVLGVEIVFRSKDDGVSRGAKQEAVEEAVEGDEGTGEAKVAQRNVGAGHGRHTLRGQRQRASDVDDGVDEECRVVVGLPAKIRAAVGIGRSATAGLLVERVPDGNVEGGGDGECNEDPEIVGEETQSFVLCIDPALDAC